MKFPLWLAPAVALLWIGFSPADAGWKAGVARTVITPEQPMWMSGYGGRDHVAEGKETDLWAKALLLDDGEGHQILAITLDLVGLDRETSVLIKSGIEKSLKLTPGQVALLCSHTHCGPVVGTNLMAMYTLGEEDHAKVRNYTAGLIRKTVALAEEAAKDLSPADISYGSGSTDFAVNRRNNKEPEVPEIRAKGEALKGPVDHAVPVLRVTTGDKLRAVLFGYACHATTLGFYNWCADYPGFAMMDVEAAHPGTVALFWAGCGADQNPLPRRTVALAKEYGKKLATAVEDVLAATPAAVVSGPLTVHYDEIPLHFAHIPGRGEVEEQLKSSNKFEVSRAKFLLKQLDAQGKLEDSYPYPVQTWTLGNGPTWTTLGGEVVVDFALRIKKEHPDRPLWVAGYANDVMAYIPSLRVLKEGGYEGGGAMLYYGHPSPWNEEVEERIIKTVNKQLAP